MYLKEKELKSQLNQALAVSQPSVAQQQQSIESLLSSASSSSTTSSIDQIDLHDENLVELNLDLTMDPTTSSNTTLSTTHTATTNSIMSNNETDLDSMNSMYNKLLINHNNINASSNHINGGDSVVMGLTGSQGDLNHNGVPLIANNNNINNNQPRTTLSSLSLNFY